MRAISAVASCMSFLFEYRNTRKVLKYGQMYSTFYADKLNQSPVRPIVLVKLKLNRFNASCSKLRLFEGSSAILV